MERWHGISRLDRMGVSMKRRDLLAYGLVAILVPGMALVSNRPNRYWKVRIHQPGRDRYHWVEAPSAHAAKRRVAELLDVERLPMTATIEDGGT